MSYAKFISTARERLASTPRATSEVPGLGSVEYAVDGSGPTVLVSHPLFGGFDVGLGVGRKFLGPGFRIIVPSRFGYLGSALPKHAKPADQADAYIAILDELGLERTIVLGYSAGGPSAIQMALRHPERVSSLVLVASALPGSVNRPPRPVAELLFGSNLVFWLLAKLGPTVTGRILGMDKHFRPLGHQRAAIQDTWTNFFPIPPRKRGVLHDIYISNPDVQGYPLEDISAPTLIISARDDAMSAHENSVLAAARIPGSHLVAFDQGGHLLLDHEDDLRREVAKFLKPSIRGPR